ncbi:hypothetical protein TNCT_28281 [Trichonephila clavata]|uniref:Uncharacterized protein n=1 Tax=Trichonephila clavata TaxID=2740835 RepID=A0A8X6HH28_TRICU|nr:hypothetical protein TNCT_28281 [Trichonephila clavata]
MILSKLKTEGLDVMNCRVQAYDNAATVAGHHTGVQQRTKDINPLSLSNAKFVPCSNHSLNLVSVEVNWVTFFGTLERCYSFIFLRRRTDGKFLNPQEKV